MKENTISINDSVIIYKGLGFNDLSDKLSDKRNELLYVNQGTLRISTTEDRASEIAAPAVVFFSPFSDMLLLEGRNLQSTLISLSREATDEITSSIKERSTLAYTFLTLHFIQIDNYHKQVLENYLNHCYAILSDISNKNRFLAFKHNTLSFYYSFWEKHVLHEVSTSNNSRKLIFQFLTLVKENYKKNRIVSYYSGLLMVTQQHLSRTIKEQTGKTPLGWINQFLIVESKRMLSNHKCSIKQTAISLGFESLSSFSSFFKKQTGLSPSEYRKQKEG